MVLTAENFGERVGEGPGAAIFASHYRKAQQDLELAKRKAQVDSSGGMHKTGQFRQDIVRRL